MTPPGRRFMLCAAVAALAGPAAAAAKLRLLVAGPPGGRLDQLARTLPAPQELAIRAAGGEDGVTGANLFDARGQADDCDALLLPGSALQAWLAGDARVRFDPARWTPVLCGQRSGMLVGDRALPGRGGRPLVLAVPEPLGPAAAGLLGLDLIGVPADPNRAADASVSLLRQGLVDTIYVDAGPIDAAPVGDVPAGGGPIPGRPLCALTPDGQGLGAVPALMALLRDRAATSALAEAWPAVAALALLDHALVLAPLADPGSAKAWRPEHPIAGTMLQALGIGGPALLAYRVWLQRRLHYAPA
jgi:hypothetical protein